MHRSETPVRRVRTGWPAALARATAAIPLFESIFGLTITFGPFHPAVEWGLLPHTGAGVLTLAQEPPSPLPSHIANCTLYPRKQRHRFTDLGCML